MKKLVLVICLMTWIVVAVACGETPPATTQNTDATTPTVTTSSVGESTVTAPETTPATTPATTVETSSETTVDTRYSVPLDTYTYIPDNYSKWNDYSEALGNAIGDGLLKIRASEAVNQNGSEKITMQIACGVPTRFAERIAFVFSAYDKDGNPVMTPDQNGSLIPIENREIAVTVLYPSIFGNDGNDITSKDFGYESGYIMSTLLNNVELNGSTDTLKIEAYYRLDHDLVSDAKTDTSSEKVQAETNRITLASLTLTMEELSKIVAVD